MDEKSLIDYLHRRLEFAKQREDVFKISKGDGQKFTHHGFWSYGYWQGMV